TLKPSKPTAVDCDKDHQVTVKDDKTVTGVLRVKGCHATRFARKPTRCGNVGNTLSSLVNGRLKKLGVNVAHNVQIVKTAEKRRRDVWVLHNVHYITILLHPSFKNFDISPDLHEKTIDLVKDELLKRQLSTLYISSTTNIYSLANTPTPDHSSTATKSLLSKSFDSPKTNSQSALSSFDELTEYMALDFQRNENDDILLF
ncbi:unnamed protein product, partial [Adineta steineri]